MDVRVGDLLEMKKPHPCGSKQWKVLRIGMDFQPRGKIEKNIRKIIREEEAQ